MKQKFKNLIPILIPLLGTLVLSYFLQISVIANPESYKSYLEQSGNYIILVYAVIQSITLLIPPLGGSFIWILMLAILGPIKGVILSYLVTTPIYCINFYLAKKYGRPFVKKLVGTKGLEKLDDFTKEAGLGTLWILKIFQNTVFDFVSYGTGLTQTKFKDFAVINFVGGIPYYLMVYFILVYSPNFFTSIIILQLVTSFLLIIYLLIKFFLNYQSKKSLSKKLNLP